MKTRMWTPHGTSTPSRTGSSRQEPSEEDIDEENTRMLRRQCLFRWAAQSVAIAMSKLPEVQKVAAFGAVAQPLEMEVPRFREFRRYRIEVLHECADLDLAVWTANLPGLKELKRAMSSGPIRGAEHAVGRRRPSPGGCPYLRCRERGLPGTALRFWAVPQAAKDAVPCPRLRGAAVPAAVRKDTASIRAIRRRAESHSVRQGQRISRAPAAD